MTGPGRNTIGRFNVQSFSWSLWGNGSTLCDDHMMYKDLEN